MTLMCCEARSVAVTPRIFKQNATFVHKMHTVDEIEHIHNRVMFYSCIRKTHKCNILYIQPVLYKRTMHLRM